MKHPPCKKVIAAWSESLEHSIPLTLRAQVWYHLCFCGPCRRCISQILAIRDLLRRMFDTADTQDAAPLPEARKEKIRAAMQAAGKTL